MGVLQGEALEYAEGSGYNTRFDLDAKGWSLLHNAASESQHRRGMLAVVRGLLEVMPIKFVDQRTRGGKPARWTALILICSARDPHGERVEIARLLADTGAERLRRDAPDYRLPSWPFLRRADPLGRGRQPPRHQRPWPQRLGRHARGPETGISRDTKE